MLGQVSLLISHKPQPLLATYKPFFSSHFFTNKSIGKIICLRIKMATPEGISEATGEKFPAADANGALNPGQNKNLEVDPGASHMVTSMQIKKEHEAKEREKKGGIHKFKSAIILSAVIVAVAGAVFSITKKIREK